LCCDVGLVSEFRLTAGCILMDLAIPAAPQAAVYANGLTNNNVTTMEHLPCSPDLVLADFYLFCRMKSALKGRRL